jgi:collagenase-like PrtC family protease
MTKRFYNYHEILNWLQLPDEYDSILEIARDFQDHISSVYFSGSGQASARSAIENEYQEEMMQELREIRNLGISLTMLYNANCYGDKAVSTAFQDEIIRSAGSMIDSLEISSITTTSPFVAKVIKREFPSLSVCASVNMWIGSEQAMNTSAMILMLFIFRGSIIAIFKKSSDYPPGVPATEKS